MQIKKILKQLSKAKKPVLLAGGGISYAEAATELNEFAERYQIPVVTSLWDKERLQRVTHSFLEWEACTGHSQQILP